MNGKSESASGGLAKVSFGVKKVEASKVDKKKVAEAESLAPQTATSAEENLPKKHKDDYVIPLINKNKWRVKEDEEKPKTEDESLAQQAAKELISESNGTQSKEQEDGLDYNVPMLERNRVPEGFEDGDKLDVSIRPDQPDDTDYEKIPIESFGMAMLRGMGFDKSKGIGRTFCQSVQVHETKLRPKGLGLGAAQRLQEGNNKYKQETIAKGDYVKALNGSFKHRCGLVTHINFEGRCDITFGGGDTGVVSEVLLKKIDKSEHDRLIKEEKTKMEDKKRKMQDGKEEKKKHEKKPRHEQPPESKKVKKRKKRTWPDRKSVV